jgi:hypothetical protein
VPYCEGEIVHTKELDIEELSRLEDTDVTIELYNGKTFALHHGYWASDGELTSDGKLKFRFEGLSAEIINA